VVQILKLLQDRARLMPCSFNKFGNLVKLNSEPPAPMKNENTAPGESWPATFTDHLN
jgi:hypothetical protein